MSRLLRAPHWCVASGFSLSSLGVVGLRPSASQGAVKDTKTEVENGCACSFLDGYDKMGSVLALLRRTDLDFRRWAVGKPKSVKSNYVVRRSY